MNKYRVTITETLEREIIVEAEDAGLAREAVNDMYRSEEIVLDAEDYVEYNIDVTPIGR